MYLYLIICPLVFLAGLIDSIAGGGGLISLPAFLIAGIPPHMALGTNKLSSCMGTTISTIRYAKNGYIHGKIAICASIMAVIGSGLGANLSLLISEAVIEHMMIVVLPVVAFYVLKNKNMGDGAGTGTVSDRKVFWIGMAAALVIGYYDGLYGPGTGTFLILILTGVAKMEIRTASGLTKAINLSSNAAALMTFIINGKVSYPLGLAAGLFCVAGHYVGSGLVVNNGQKIVRPIVLTVLGILMIKIIFG